MTDEVAGDMPSPIAAVPGAPPGFAGMLSLVSVSILIFIGLFSLAPVLPSIKANFAGTPNVELLAPLVGAMSGFAFALGCLAVGGMIARHGYRRV